MTDEEKIEQAAEKNCREFFKKIDLPGPGSTHDQIFKAGVEWRDENPSPKVLRLVNAADRVSENSHVAIRRNYQMEDLTRLFCSIKLLEQALAAWDKK